MAAKRNSNVNGAPLGFEAKLWAGRRQAAQQHGRGGVQARRPRADLPQVHLRRLRGEARGARGAEGAGRRPGGPGRVPRREHLLGAEGGALGAPQGQRAAADDRQARRRRDGRDRARQPVAQGRAAEGLRPARPRQAAARAADRPGRRHRPRRRRPTAPRTSSAASTSTSSSQFASAEGKKGGQFYTPSRVVRVLVEMLAPYKGRVYDPCCGSGGMFVQSEKFIEAHGGQDRRHRDLRPGVELHDLAAGEDEPRDPRHRRADRATPTGSTATCTPT